VDGVHKVFHIRQQILASISVTSDFETGELKHDEGTISGTQLHYLYKPSFINFQSHSPNKLPNSFKSCLIAQCDILQYKKIAQFSECVFLTSMASDEAIYSTTDISDNEDQAISIAFQNGNSKPQHLSTDREILEDHVSPSASSTKPPNELTSLPYAIFHLILTHSSLCSMACFGLTNKLFYTYLKIIHPAPIPLSSTVEYIPPRAYPVNYTCWMSGIFAADNYGQNCIRGPRKLGPLLRDWMGSKYRLWYFYTIFLFLPIEEYGLPTATKFPEKIKALKEKYKVQHESHVKRLPFGLEESEDKGDQRMLLVVQALERTIPHLGMHRGNVKQWKEFVERSFVPIEKRHFPLSEKVRDEWRWILFGEGIRMLGL